MQKKLFSFFKPVAPSQPPASGATATAASYHETNRVKRRLSQESTGVTPPAKTALALLAATPTPVTEPAGAIALGESKRAKPDAPAAPSSAAPARARRGLVLHSDDDDDDDETNTLRGSVAPVRDDDDDSVFVAGDDDDDDQSPTSNNSAKRVVSSGDHDPVADIARRQKQPRTQKPFEAWECGAEPAAESAPASAKTRSRLMEAVGLGGGSAGDDGGVATLEEAIVQAYPFLRDSRDAQRRRHAEDGDATTLHISDADWRALSDVRKQYWAVKRDHFDTIVLFQVGSFYELFARDAELGSRLFGLKIHSGTQAGVPTKDWQTLADKFVAHGYKVLRVDQGAAEGKIRARRVGEHLTAGTVVDPHFLPAGGAHNYVMSVAVWPGDHSVRVGVVYADLTLLEAHAGAWDDDEHLTQLLALLDTVRPAELVFCTGQLSRATLAAMARECSTLQLSPVARAKWWGSLEARRRVTDSMRALPPSLAAPESDAAMEGFGALLNYLQQSGVAGRAQLLLACAVAPLSAPGSVTAAGGAGPGALLMDPVTARNLDLFESASGRVDGTLLHLLNNTRAPYGERLLRRWLAHPLTDVRAIRERQQAVNQLMAGLPVDADAIARVEAFLRRSVDVERVVCRLRAVYAECGDGTQPPPNGEWPEPPVKVAVFVDAVCKLRAAHKLWATLAGAAAGVRDAAPLLARLFTLGSAEMPDFGAVLDEAAAWDASTDSAGAATLVLRDGAGDAAYEGARRLARETDAAVEAWLKRARAHTGQPKLKLKCESDGRRLIQLPAGKKDADVPDEWRAAGATKTQTNYRSDELDELAAAATSAAAALASRASSMAAVCMARFAAHYALWRRVMHALATVDCLMSLATASTAFGESCTPTMLDSGAPTQCELLDARHPILERAVVRAGAAYIPNDIRLAPGCPVALITGPNSGGKSTVLRTVAVTTVLAQLGCRVPARAATLSVVDRIFTRIGAQDHLMRGQSTFMVEMSETASILRDATPRSLLIIDELGRGTSTNDGYAIAWAVLQHLRALGALTLFATHYHGLVDDFAGPSVASYFMAHLSDDSAREVVFLYQLREGVGQSYGLNVARLAGLPAELLDRAATIIDEAKRDHMFDTSQRIEGIVRDVLACRNAADLRAVFDETG